MRFTCQLRLNSISFLRLRSLLAEELDRAIYLSDTGLTKAPTPFVTPEDILLAKLSWFRSGGETSEVQWRDIRSVIRSCGYTLDRHYLHNAAIKLGVGDLLNKALNEGESGRAANDYLSLRP